MKLESFLKKEKKKIITKKEKIGQDLVEKKLKPIVEVDPKRTNKKITNIFNGPIYGSVCFNNEGMIELKSEKNIGGFIGFIKIIFDKIIGFIKNL